MTPVTKDDSCTLCGVCTGVCPTSAIVVDEGVMTSVELFIGVVPASRVVLKRGQIVGGPDDAENHPVA